MRITAYVFASKSARGLSVLSNGSNLPRLLDGSEWRPVGAKITDSDQLAQFTADPTLALSNIRTRGYHFCRIPEPADEGEAKVA
jgi:hypothetical protein